MGVSTYKLKQLFEYYGYEKIIKKTGRLQNTISEQEIQNVQSYRTDFRVDNKRTADALQRHGIKINENRVRQIFKAEELFLHKKSEPKGKNTKKGFMPSIKINSGILIYTNSSLFIKGIKIKVYLISFIDDATRFIIHAEILQAKTLHWGQMHQKAL